MHQGVLRAFHAKCSKDAPSGGWILACSEAHQSCIMIHPAGHEYFESFWGASFVHQGWHRHASVEAQQICIYRCVHVCLLGGTSCSRAYLPTWRYIMLSMYVVCTWVLSPSPPWTHAWIAPNFDLKVSADIQICILSVLFLVLMDAVHKWSESHLHTKPNNVFGDAFQMEQSSDLWGTSSLCVVSVSVYGQSNEVEILCFICDQSLFSLSLFSLSYCDFMTILALDVIDIENLRVSIFNFGEGMFGHFHRVDAT